MNCQERNYKKKIMEHTAMFEILMILLLMLFSLACVKGEYFNGVLLI